MATVDIGNESFKENLDKNDIVILDFWAGWCGPCQAFAPTYEEVSKSYPEIIFGKVDTEAEGELSSYFQIRSIPTIMIMRDRIVVFEHSGVLGRDDLIKVIDQVRTLDMDQVKTEVDKEEKELSEKNK